MKKELMTNAVKIKVIAFVENYYPGWVRFSFSDIDGVTHFFVDKAPYVGAGYLGPESQYPVDGSYFCEVIDHTENIVTIDITKPIGPHLESKQEIFKVFTDQIIVRDRHSEV